LTAVRRWYKWPRWFISAPITLRGNSKRQPVYHPTNFVITRRVELAQQLLCGRQDVSLAEVATRAGFSDESQFSFHFKRIVGVTPGQFRASKIT
jgi:AraC-like DNA-binding protein